jgi:hypothetical protein
MSRTAELTRRTYPISTSYPHALTGHRQRASLALLLIAVVFCMLYAPLSARADWYLFSRFNAIGGSQQNFQYGPAINASGQLVFYQSPDESIYKADLVTHEKIVTTKLYSPSSPFVSLGASPRINDLGDVGFEASRHNGHSEVVRYTALTQGLTTIAEGDGVGVAVNPFYRPAPAVPEPAALLLALVGLALLPRRRRKQEAARNA